MTRISAHSGSEGSRPGSLEELSTALACGADTVEIDLRLQGETVVLSHDPLRAEGTYVPLRAALELLRPTDARINCDLKEAAACAPALALFRACGMEDRLEFTGDYPLTAPVEETVRYQVYFNAENIPDVPLPDKIGTETAERLVAWLTAQRHPALVGFNVDVSQLTEDALAVFAARSVSLTCWTVDDPEDLALCLRGGVAVITTNRIRAARQAIDAAQGNPA